jgi:hypothetical protein
MAAAGDGLAVTALVNGAPIRTLDVISGVAHTAGEPISLKYDFVRPLTAGTYVELAVSGTNAAASTLSVGVAGSLSGAECYVSRESTLVHVVPQ